MTVRCSSFQHAMYFLILVKFEYDITTWSIQKMGSLLCCTLEANTEISTITSSMLSFVNEEVAWVSFYLFHSLIASNKPPVYERSEQEHLLFVIVTSTLKATRSKSKSYHHFIYIFFILLNINKSCFRRILAYFIPLRILKGTFTTFLCSGWNIFFFYCGYPDRRCSRIRRGPLKVRTTLTLAKFVAFSWESKRTLSPRLVLMCLSHFFPPGYHWSLSNITNKHISFPLSP